MHPIAWYLQSPLSPLTMFIFLLTSGRSKVRGSRVGKKRGGGGCGNGGFNGWGCRGGRGRGRNIRRRGGGLDYDYDNDYPDYGYGQDYGYGGYGIGGGTPPIGRGQRYLTPYSYLYKDNLAPQIINAVNG